MPAPICPISFGDAEEQRQLRQPLIEKRAPVDQDQRAASALGHEVCANDGLACAGRRDEHTNVVLEKRAHGLLLDRCQLPAEAEAERFAGDALVLDFEGHTVLAQQRLELGLTASRQAHVLREILRARDHARGRGRGEAHALLLVELRVLEGREALDPVDQRRREARLLDEELLGEDGSYARWQRFGDHHRLRLPRREARPRCRVVLIRRVREPHTDDGSLPCRLACDQIDGARIDAHHRGKIGPLLVIGVRFQLVVEEHRVPLLSRLVLER